MLASKHFIWLAAHLPKDLGLGRSLSKSATEASCNGSMQVTSGCPSDHTCPWTRSCREVITTHKVADGTVIAEDISCAVGKSHFPEPLREALRPFHWPVIDLEHTGVMHRACDSFCSTQAGQTEAAARRMPSCQEILSECLEPLA